MSQEKIEKLLEVLKDLPLENWNKIKNEVDIIYREIEYKEVPNKGSGTLKENLIHKFVSTYLSKIFIKIIPHNY